MKYTCKDKKKQNVKTNKHGTHETRNKHDKKKTNNGKRPKLRYPVQVSLFLMACAHINKKITDDCDFCSW